ncbi:hypothetical protein [Alistipes senegalensis]|uniref:hypothetical protein n=1 Tax=Alistipes senegalensis TaxID=1288121 RepID=UPI0024302841|nr:hypothetical protein [Alistipes senegalensis]
MWRASRPSTLHFHLYRAGSVLTTATSCETGAIIRSIRTRPQCFSCVRTMARLTFAWSSSEPHSTL